MAPVPAAAGPVRSAQSPAGRAGLNLLVQGANWEVLQTARYASGKWAPTRQLFRHEYFHEFTDVTQNGRLRLFIQRPSGWDEVLCQAYQKPDGTWTDPTPIRGLPPIDEHQPLDTGHYMAAAVVGRQVHLVYIDSRGQLLHTAERSNGTWTPPDPVVPGGVYRRDVFRSVAVAAVNGALHVAAVDETHNKLLYTVRSAGGSWSAWGNVLARTGTPRHWGRALRVAMAGFGKSAQVVVLTDGRVAQYHAVRRPDGSWTHWSDIAARVNFWAVGFQGTVMNEVTAANVNGELQTVFASDDNRGTLFHTIRRADGSWTPARLVQRMTNLSSWRPSGVAGAAG